MLCVAVGFWCLVKWFENIKWILLYIKANFFYGPKRTFSLVSNWLLNCHYLRLATITSSACCSHSLPPSLSRYVVVERGKGMKIDSSLWGYARNILYSDVKMYYCLTGGMLCPTCYVCKALRLWAHFVNIALYGSSHFFWNQRGNSPQ